MGFLFRRKTVEPTPAPLPTPVPVPHPVPQPQEPPMTVDRRPRGIRNNNPGNIEKGDNWQGLTTGSDPRFATFTTPEYGIRALAKVLTTYQTKHNLRTAKQIIGRWAPATAENPSTIAGIYPAEVARAAGVGVNDPIDLGNPETMVKVVTAIIQHENGQQPYSQATIRQGVRLALGK